jgi:hypothetical protein
MNYVEALLSTVSLADALAELRRHGVSADFQDGRLIDADRQLVAIADQHGEFSGEDILGYLGY